MSNDTAYWQQPIQPGWYAGGYRLRKAHFLDDGRGHERTGVDGTALCGQPIGFSFPDGEFTRPRCIGCQTVLLHQQRSPFSGLPHTEATAERP